jgi:hypothetical protein
MNRRSLLRYLGVGVVGGLAGWSLSQQATRQMSTSPSTPLPTAELTKLAADDGDTDDQFGTSVSISGNGTTAIIGADADEDPNGDGAGSAYVFSAAGEGWRQQAKLVPEDGDGGGVFGFSVALSADGTTAIIGTPGGDGAGSAYVFSAAGEGWRQQAKLVPEDGDEHDEFGLSAALSADGTTAIIGAHQDEDPNGEAAGSAYVFAAAGEGWRQQAKLVPEDGDEQDRFGFSVALSGDGTAVIIGAPGDEPNSAGSAYVFAAAGEGWRQQAKLAPEDGDEHDEFGLSVAVSSNGTTATIGAPGHEEPNGRQAGSAYVFA